MKESFREYYKLSEVEFEALWKDAILVFDTNVLLNLYRYQSSTRDSLLTFMEALGNRVWIPHHVGLEFQRNRLKVIAEQHKRFSEVKEIVEKHVAGMKNEFNSLHLEKRHSHINPEQLIENFEAVKETFLAQMAEQERESVNVGSSDEIRDRLDTLFFGRVGAPFPNQGSIDNLSAEGADRYKNSIPPGFKDISKDEAGSDAFAHSGLVYKRTYGDLIIWKQIISHACKNKIKNIIFVTDDNKEDWWWKIKSNGTKTIGVLPELRDEIRKVAGVELFQMYSTEGLLRYASEQPNANVTEEEIEEVREVRTSQRDFAPGSSQLSSLHREAEAAISRWLASKFSDLEISSVDRFIDYIGYKDGLRSGFIAKYMPDIKMLSRNLSRWLRRAEDLLDQDEFAEIQIVLAVPRMEVVGMIENEFSSFFPIKRGMIEIVIGLVDTSEKQGEAYEFLPVRSFRIGNRDA